MNSKINNAMNGKIKVLWFSNVSFSNAESTASGTWLKAMASLLVNTGEIELYNISQAAVKNSMRHDSQLINQWLVPNDSPKSNGLPSSKIIQEIKGIVKEIEPDIIHIWGTEYYWALLTARGYIGGNVILEIQGLKFTIEKYCFSGLSLIDILKCFGIKEFLKPSRSLIGLKYLYRKWGKFEKEMLMKHNMISTQSNWVRAYVKTVNPTARIFETSVSLRKEFCDANKWEISRCIPYQIFTSVSSLMSFKGLHILLEAIAILKKRYNQINLVIAGTVLSGIRQGGYTKWLKNKIKRIGIEQNVFWIGALDAKNLITQMYRANVFVIPSFVESYCLAFDEALTVGVPTVASFAGAMPELATHEKTALFFSPGDVIMCANTIERLFEDRNYADMISQNAYDSKKLKANKNIADEQLLIYSNVLKTNRVT